MCLANLACSSLWTLIHLAAAHRLAESGSEQLLPNQQTLVEKPRMPLLVKKAPRLKMRMDLLQGQHCCPAQVCQGAWVSHPEWHLDGLI
jgi:hypothetical protein